MTHLQIAKNTLKGIANDAKQKHRGDLPMIRQIINDSADSISRDMNLSEYNRGSLSNYACKLHPKK